jgi:RNA polymerase sigma-70 factor (ECF subfamily)
VSVDWGAVYRDTCPALVRFLYRKVWDTERAQDLAQEAFVRALRHEPENPRAWLFHAAANLARDEARRTLTRRRHLMLLHDEARGAAREEETETMQRSERIDAVRAALDQLAERDRDALLLREAGLSYPEIAAELGLAVGSVGTTLARARQRLVRAYTALEEKHAARG